MLCAARCQKMRFDEACYLEMTGKSSVGEWVSGWVGRWVGGWVGGPRGARKHVSLNASLEMWSSPGRLPVLAVIIDACRSVMVVKYCKSRLMWVL